MIKKIKNSISIEKLIFISIMTILIGIPAICIYIYTCNKLHIYNVININHAQILWWALPVLVILYVIDMILNERKVTIIDILMYLLIALGIISTIFAVDMKTSIFGEHARDEGLLSLVSYYFIFLNVKNISNKKYKDIIIKTIIILGLVNLTYAILQVYTNASFIIRFQAPFKALGLCGHPNFFGSYMVTLAAFAFSMYMLERKNRYLVLSMLFFMGICLCASTGPLLSFILMAIFFVIYYRKQIKWKSLLKIASLLVIIYFFVAYSVTFVQNKLLNNNKIKSDYYVSSMVSDFSSKNMGNGRVRIWEESLPLLKKYWPIGAGLDNFGKVYGVKDGVYYDKAHNIYLQTAITNGIFALIIYLTVIGYIFFKGLKIKDTKYISLLMAFVAYCIQAFANISVVEVAPTFFAITGLVLGKIQNDQNKRKIKES